MTRHHIEFKTEFIVVKSSGSQQ